MREASKGELIFDGSYKQGDEWLDQNHFHSSAWGTSSYNACLPHSDSLVVVPAPGGRSGYAGKFTMRPDDHCNSDNDFIGIEHSVQIAHGDDRWYSFSIYLPAGFNHSTWMSWFQIKPRAGYGYGGIHSLNTNMFTGTWGYIPGDVYSMSNVENLAPLTTGWTDWMVHIKWTNDNTGVTDYYKNGDLVSTHHNIRTIATYNGVPVTDYALMNIIYRGHETSTVSQHSFNIKIGLTRADVEYCESSE